MPQSSLTPIHCINPGCIRPAGQTWGNKYCQSCGAPLLLQSRYVPLSQLGSGGFAVTYTAYDLKTKTEQVLKVLVETSPKALALFEQEAAVLASLRHPGVPKVDPKSYFLVPVAYPQRRMLPCLVMEKINGQTLEDALRMYPQGCPENLVIDWLSQAVDILHALHSRQIIHRDIKPSNLMLRQKTLQLVAIDFGGAKQIGNGKLNSAGSSTRLFSPGYSPPEQIVGGVVSPATDFYALGRTMIHLLTGCYPGDLEDPITGECVWRSRININPALGNLLDDMIAPVTTQRPPSAAAIQGRLTRIAPLRRRTRKVVTKAKAISYSVAPGLFDTLKWIWNAIATVVIFLYRTTTGTVKTCFNLAYWLWKACSDTLLGMLLGGFGGSLGAGVGFWLAYQLPVGDRISDLLSEQLSQLMPNTHWVIEPVVLLFGLAGLGTAWGLTEAGSFGQIRRFWPAALMGILGYVLGWSVYGAIAPTPAIVDQGLLGFSAIAISSLTLGLGLPRPHLLHAAVTGMGTATLLAGIVYKSSSPVVFDFFSAAIAKSAGWSALWESIAFFGLLGVTGGFCLGFSYYFLVPFLRLLGFR